MGFSSQSKTAFIVTLAIWLGLAAFPGSPPVCAQTQTPKPAPKHSLRGRLRLTKFYDTPVPLPPDKPGTLIRAQPFDEYDLPLNVSAIRILYHSTSPSGEDVAASGVVLVPNRAAPPGGWPVIAWAHGFAGHARACAPSLSRNLHSGAFLNMYVNLGYAVVAADYAGLGSSARNPFADLPTHAQDVLYSVPAARAAVPQLGLRWVGIGTGEGGAVALTVAEAEAQRGDRGYLGSVAISGALDLKTLVERLAQGPWQDTLASIAYGIKTVYPEFQLDHMLSSKGLDRYHQVEQDCVARDTAPAVPAAEMLDPGWEKDSQVQSFFERNLLGRTRALAPLLIISGQDRQAEGTTSAEVVSRMCRQGDRIDFEAYPGADSAEIVGTSVSAQIAWIKARFSGHAARSNCP